MEQFSDPKPDTRPTEGKKSAFAPILNSNSFFKVCTSNVEKIRGKTDSTLHVEWGKDEERTYHFDMLAQQVDERFGSETHRFGQCYLKSLRLRHGKEESQQQDTTSKGMQAQENRFEAEKRVTRRTVTVRGICGRLVYVSAPHFPYFSELNGGMRGQVGTLSPVPAPALSTSKLWAKLFASNQYTNDIEYRCCLALWLHRIAKHRVGCTRSIVLRCLFRHVGTQSNRLDRHCAVPGLCERFSTAKELQVDQYVPTSEWKVVRHLLQTLLLTYDPVLLLANRERERVETSYCPRDLYDRVDVP